MKRNALFLSGAACAAICLLSIADNLLRSDRELCDCCGAAMDVVGRRNDDLCQATFYECPVCHRAAHDHEWIWETGRTPGKFEDTIRTSRWSN